MDFKLDGKAENALSHLQDTTLTPMEETLFKAWTKANKIDDPDAAGDNIDYRGIYKATDGAILPNGELARMAAKMNSKSELERILQERMAERISQTVESVGDKQEQLHKEERQDVTHKQKMDMERLKQKKAPHEHRMKQMDLQKQEVGIKQQELGNQAKEIDLAKTIFAPQQPKPAGSGNASK